MNGLPRQEQDVEQRRPGRPRITDEDAVARAVLQALVDRGYDGMTVDHVARLAGVGRATLYRRWPTKTAMVIDALGRSQVAVLEDPDSGDPQADFEVLLRILYAAIEREHPIVRALEIETDRHPDLGVALQRDFVAQRKDVLIGVLRRAAAAGLLRAPSDLELLARVGPALIWEQFALSAEKPSDSDLVRRISGLLFIDRVPSHAGVEKRARAADIGVTTIRRPPSSTNSAASASSRDGGFA